MGLMRALGRAGTLALAGAAAGYYLRRRGLLGAPAELTPAPASPSEPLFVPQPEEPAPQPPAEEAEDVAGEVEEPAAPEQEEAEPAPQEAESVPEEQEPVAEEAEPVPEEAEIVSAEVEPEPEPDRPDVTAVVDDLLAGEGSLRDAQVVASEDARVAEAVRVALAETPGLLSAPIEIEVVDGRVTLQGELERPESIEAVEEKARSVEGVRELRSRLHLPGMPAPDAG